jgi:hypothetical protein
MGTLSRCVSPFLATHDPLVGISTATVARNSELESRVVALEQELTALKHIHSATLAAAGGRGGGHNPQTHEVHLFNCHCRRHLTGYLGDFHSLRWAGARPRSKYYTDHTSVIDGDANVFDQSFFRAGERGGHAAGQVLAKGIADYLGSLNELGAVARISFWVS